MFRSFFPKLEAIRTMARYRLYWSANFEHTDNVTDRNRIPEKMHDWLILILFWLMGQEFDLVGSL